MYYVFIPNSSSSYLQTLGRHFGVSRLLLLPLGLKQTTVDEDGETFISWFGAKGRALLLLKRSAETLSNAGEM